MKKSYLTMITIILGSVAGQSVANPPQLSSLTNNFNTAGCGLTDTARFRFEKPARVYSLKTWFDASKGGNSLPFQLNGAQGIIASGTFTKGSCDQNQSQWCEGVTDLKGIVLAPGSYAIKARSEALCANTESGGTGFIQAEGTVEGSVQPNHKGYELYFNSKLVSGPDAANYTLQQARENCAFNLKNHPKVDIVCMMDDKNITSQSVTIEGNSNSPKPKPCINDPAICTNPFVEDCCVTKVPYRVSTKPNQ
jgi:hypothetical protein